MALVGLDQFITKNATLCDEKSEDAHTIKAMKFSVRCATRRAVLRMLCCAVAVGAVHLPWPPPWHRRLRLAPRPSTISPPHPASPACA